MLQKKGCYDGEKITQTEKTWLGFLVNRKKLGVILGGTFAAVAATGVVLVASKMTKIETTELDTDKLNIAETSEEQETDYLNVALFGLDSREGDLGKGNRSDTMMIASLNKATGEVKLVSVYRDTLLELDDGSYNKANAAYAFGGPGRCYFVDQP